LRQLGTEEPFTYKSLLAELKSAAAATGALTDTDAWYQASYPVFTATHVANPKTRDGFLTIVAYAYSWVATIPTTDPRSHFERVRDAIQAIREAKCGSTYDAVGVRALRSAAVTSVQRALGIDSTAGSVVIASKVLHFWNSELAPMVDANVANGWRKLHQINSDWGEALSTSGNDRVTTISSHPGLEQYLSYWELVYRFGQHCGISYREFDKLMFRCGRRSAK
jgi:hypothetical protein